MQVDRAADCLVFVFMIQFCSLISKHTFAVCHQCGDESAGIPCTAQQIYDPTIQPRACPSGKDYCMTDVYDTNGNDMVYKR